MEMITKFVCPKCGRSDVERHPQDRFCVDCVRAERSRMAYLYANNDGWIDEAKELGLDVWERQPKETNWEFMIWQTYMGMYPKSKPTYAAVAEQLNTSLSVVRRVAKHWDFTVRLQMYMEYCEAQLRETRIQAMVDMNNDYIEAAATLRSCLKEAVQRVNPYQLADKPRDLVAVAKLADDMERKARLDVEQRTSQLAEMHGCMTEEKQRPIKKDDLAEVVKILMESGALGSITQIGVKETTTRETVLVDSDGSSAAAIQGGDEE